MTNDDVPDLFTHVHKGLRRALFAACTALGRAEGDADRERAARGLLAEALHFVAHHGENEDLLLVPLLRDRAPDVAARLAHEHAELDTQRQALSRDQPISALYLALCAFTSRYLAHLDDEERVLEPRIRSALSSTQIGEFGRQSIQRTAPHDQRMMLGWMIPAITRDAARSLLARLPAPLATELRVLADAPEV